MNVLTLFSYNFFKIASEYEEGDEEEDAEDDDTEGNGYDQHPVR